MTEEELRIAFDKLTEELQSICEAFGCHGGENRTTFIRRQLWAYKSALLEIRASRDELYHWEIADYALALRRKA